MKMPGSRHMVLLLVTALLLLSAILPLIRMPQRVVAEAASPTIELAYDDGVPWKTIRESVGGCDLCYTYQGVRFNLGGVAMAALTAIRFYTNGDPGTLEVVVTDAIREKSLIDPIRVTVSAAQWYTVTVPETMISGDFWVWVKVDETAMLYHDAGTASRRSAYLEQWQAGTFPITTLDRGDLLIRAAIRAEIRVGEGQDYATIQEAVDAAGEGLTIVVYDGTYDENVVVDKKLYIMSRDGPSTTAVRAQNPGASVFSVTADGVAISGFSIEGASGSGAAGVHLDRSIDSLVAGNTISDNYYGVLISAASTNNLVVDNDIASNVYGVWLEGERNNISGNRIDGNTGPVGSGVYLSAYAANNYVHFNKFSAAPGMEQVPQVFCDSTADLANAVNNWWGSATGPYHQSANANGAGAAVGEGVRFSPWLKAEPVAVKTAATTPGSSVVNAGTEAATSVIKTGTGTPTVWVARYDANPGAAFPESGTAVGKWIDVYFNTTSNVLSVEIRVYYSEAEAAAVKDGSLRLHWWDGTAWKVCSRTGVNTTERFVWAILDPTSTPALAGLGGTPFVIGTTGSGFALWWVVVGIGVVVVLAIVGWFVLRVLPRRGYGEYDYE